MVRASLISSYESHPPAQHSNHVKVVYQVCVPLLTVVDAALELQGTSVSGARVQFDTKSNPRLQLSPSPLLRVH